MTKVLIVDDHPVVRAGLRRLLSDSAGIEVAGEADSARSALERSRAEAWDLILLDMGLPDADGLELLTQLKLDQPNRPVLILTMRLNGELAVRALRAGAAGYLGKDTPPAAIVEAVRRAVSGRPHVSEWLAEQLALRVRADAEQPAHTHLSDREFEVLMLLAGGARPKDIAARLSLSIKTVSSYRARVLEKLSLSSNAELAIYALRHGLIDGAEARPIEADGPSLRLD
jgi:DNA-binding NarL/FixJ family response regulator